MSVPGEGYSTKICRAH